MLGPSCRSWGEGALRAGRHGCRQLQVYYLAKRNLTGPPGFTGHGDGEAGWWAGRGRVKAKFPISKILEHRGGVAPAPLPLSSRGRRRGAAPLCAAISEPRRSIGVTAACLNRIGGRMPIESTPEPRTADLSSPLRPAGNTAAEKDEAEWAAGAASRLATIAAPTRHVRVTNLQSEDCWEVTDADGTAACTGAAAGLGPVAGSRPHPPRPRHDLLLAPALRDGCRGGSSR